MTIAGREIDAAAGTYILIAPGVVCTFANTSNKPVRFLSVSSPGWLENYLRDLAGAMCAGMMPGTVAFERIIAKYDFVVSR